MTEICLEEIEGNERDQIETEIKDALRIFFKNRENPVEKIVVAEDFNETVRKFLHKSSWEKRDYNQLHEYGVALAKTIPEFENREISFNLILDRRLFQRLDFVGRFDRLGLFIHEFTHMVDDKLRFDSVGQKEFRAVPKSKKETLFKVGWIIWQEYHAERIVLEIYEAIRNEKITFEYKPKLGNFETLKENLSSLPKFLRGNISKFRNWQLTPEEIHRLIMSRVNSILILYAYVFALSDAVAKLKDRVVDLRHLDGFRFLSEDLLHIHVILLELHKRKKEYNSELIHRIGSLIDSILMKCGLEIRDAPEGYYIEVHDG